MYDESVIGIDVFLTKAKGVGGILRKEPEDFVVNEIPLKPEEVKDGFYTAALVRSRNWETNRLLRMCARKLRISRKGIYFAGTKDKRAVTTQLLVFSAPLQDVVSMNIRDVEVFEAYETDKRIQMGDLVGNEFEVAIRDITVPEEEIMERVESVRKDILDTGGFPNFFGVQRFGAVRPITHVVGKHIVLGEFDKAVHVYIANPIEGENEEAFEARKALEDTGDYSKALQTYPKTLSFEKAILNRLVKNEGDFIGALEQLPRNLLSMFIHSYQSYLFNKMLSQRIQGGAPLNEPLPGDLIMPIDKLGRPDHERTIKVEEQNIEKIGNRCKEGKAFVSGILFGSDGGFAGGEMGDIERKIVEKEGLKPEDFIIPKMPQLSSKGIRRELLAPLKELESEVLKDKVLLKFRLSKGCYATSLLREFMKSGDIMDY